MNWAEKARKTFGSKFVKFEEDGIEHTIKFLKEPYERTFKGKDGTDKISLEFEVQEAGQEKVFSCTSKRLLRKLIEEEEKATLIGRTLTIKAIGSGTARDWIVR